MFFFFLLSDNKTAIQPTGFPWQAVVLLIYCNESVNWDNTYHREPGSFHYEPD